MSTIPYVRGVGRNATLFVDDKPFHLRGGELHNSSASDLDYMNRRVWPALKPLNMNTVIAPVYWECLEPEEGVFDYSLVDGLIEQARENGVRLVLLWFGLWKNSTSSYVPNWVKLDRERFWYVQAKDGGCPKYYTMDTLIISPLCQEAVKADANAFSHLMAHLKEVDEERTVVVIQVENEIGVLGADRDYSPAANDAFAKPVPEVLCQAFVKNYQAGTAMSWEEVFGEDAPQSFIAWHYSQAVNTIASAGKAEYPLPMYANCWLEQEPWIPGTYPSGGPISRNIPVWKVGAPVLDFFGPDIYVPDFAGTVKLYGTDSNPLFIPETRLDCAPYLYALGKYNAMCFSPFGIEDTFDPEAGEVDDGTLRLLHIDREAFAKMEGIAVELGKAYALTAEMDELITRAHAEGRAYGFYSGDAKAPDASQATGMLKLMAAQNGGKLPKMTNIAMSHLNVTVIFDNADYPTGGGMLIELGDYEFLAMAINCTLIINSNDGAALDVLAKEEGRFAGGNWKRGRILNGDERYRNVFKDKVELIRFKYLPY